MSAVAIFALVCVALLLGFLGGYAVATYHASEQLYTLAEVEEAQRDAAYERARKGDANKDFYDKRGSTR